MQFKNIIMIYYRLLFFLTFHVKLQNPENKRFDVIAIVINLRILNLDYLYRSEIIYILY